MKQIIKLFVPYRIIYLIKRFKKYINLKDKNKEYHFDVIFSVGVACRPARYLKQHGLRLYANPLDWMSCSLETVIHLYKTKFDDFFIDFSADEVTPNKFFDTKNCVLSMHYADIGIDSVSFNQKMKTRFEIIDKNLRTANSIGFICNRNEDIEVFFDFLTEMGKIYPGNITLINIRHNEKIDRNLAHIHHSKNKISKRLTLVQYEFNDVHEQGSNPNINPDFWLGNENRWNSIVKKITLNQNLITYLMSEET